MLFRVIIFIVISLCIQFISVNTLYAVEPPINGTFVEVNAALPASQIPAYITEIKALGMDTLIVLSTQIRSGPCESFQFIDVISNSTLDVFMSEAQRQGIDVYLGLTFHGYPDTAHCAGGPFWSNTNAVNRTITETTAHASRLYTRYRNNTSLKGWYIPDEPNIFWFYYNPTMMENLYRYYRTVHTQLKQLSPQLKTIVSPNFGGANIYATGVTGLSPQEVEAQIRTLKDETQIDIYAWQDTIGGASLNGFARPFEEYLAILPRIFTPDQLWINNELFNYKSNGGSSLARINKQIRLTSSSAYSKRIVWNQAHHMSTVWGWHHQEALRLLRAYQSYYGIQGEYITPSSYSWASEPSPNYPDTGNKLTNSEPGNPFVFGKGFGTEWVGITNSTNKASLHVNFSSTKRIDWLAFHTVQHVPSSVFFPRQMRINCNNSAGINVSSKTIDYSAISYLDRTIENAEYTMANFEPLAFTCASLDIDLQGAGGWIFLSEMEIVGPGETLPGDANNDREVDGLDYIVWLNHYNQSGISGAQNGDFDNNNTVDGMDYVIWLIHYSF